MSKKISLLGIILSFLIFFSCNKNNDTTEEDILPSNFKVDIPSTLSDDTQVKVLADSMKPEDVYSYLRFFIHVGEGAADLVQEIINAIREHNLSQEMSFSFTSADDGRVKNVVIKSNVSYDGVNWEFGLTLSDAENEANVDGGVGMQVFWNRNPVEGIAVIKPKNLNVNLAVEWQEGMAKIEYSENPETTNGYEARMIVSIYNYPIDTANRFSMRNMKMFVGRIGDRVDVYGNSDHPIAWILIPRQQPGIDWAFVASSSASLNIAAVEVGLPPNYLNSSSRQELLGTYSVFNVLFNEIWQYYYSIYGIYPDSSVVEFYLSAVKPPAFFDANGFVAAVNPPSSDYNTLLDVLKSLTPYNPAEIKDLTISFEMSLVTR